MKYKKLKNKSIKARWLRALRGRSRQGEYDQCHGRLCKEDIVKGDSFCCLGVLVNETTGFDAASPAHDDGSVIGWHGMIPDRPAAKLGLDHGTQGVLVDMNDHGRSFKQIANWIEKNL